jgi:tyrosine-protein phosphatase SIW14
MTVPFRATFARVGLAAGLITLSLGMPVAAQTGAAGPRSSVPDISNIRIDNFGRINANYYRGAQPQGRDYADLAALGVKTVIDLTSDDSDAAEQTLAERAGLKYVQIAMTTHQPPTSAQLANFLQIVNDPARQPVFVHCVGGRHRTGVMTAAYRMSHDQWNSNQAFSEMKQYKFGLDMLHTEFKDFVYAYRPAVVATPAAAVAAASVR